MFVGDFFIAIVGALTGFFWNDIYNPATSKVLSKKYHILASEVHCAVIGIFCASYLAYKVFWSIPKADACEILCFIQLLCCAYCLIKGLLIKFNIGKVK